IAGGKRMIAVKRLKTPRGGEAERKYGSDRREPAQNSDVLAPPHRHQSPALPGNAESLTAIHRPARAGQEVVRACSVHPGKIAPQAVSSAFPPRANARQCEDEGDNVAARSTGHGRAAAFRRSAVPLTGNAAP